MTHFYLLYFFILLCPCFLHQFLHLYFPIILCFDYYNNLLISFPTFSHLSFISLSGYSSYCTVLTIVLKSFPSPPISDRIKSNIPDCHQWQSQILISKRRKARVGLAALLVISCFFFKDTLFSLLIPPSPGITFTLLSLESFHHNLNSCYVNVF